MIQLNDPLISVIMPVYNEDKYIQESINSILNQSFFDFELIIINDCSTDYSSPIIKSYEDPRIKFIDLKVNHGFPQSRNIGLMHARGKYIALLDGDDISAVDRLRTQFDYLEKNKHIFLVGSSAIYIDEEGKEIGRFRKYDDYEMLAWRMPKSCSIISSSVMFRNEGYLYPESYYGPTDYKFYLDLLSQEKNLTNISDFLVKYRVHGKSMCVYDKDKQDELVKKIQEENTFKGKFKLRFIPKLLIHYIKTYGEKRGK